MLHIILSILKWIVILLLVLLGIILALLLIILVVPFCYSADGKKEEETEFHAKLDWLFFVLRVRASFEKNKFKYYVKVFGFLLAGEDEKPKKTGRKRRRRKSKKAQKAKPLPSEELSKEEEALLEEIWEEDASIKETVKDTAKKEQTEKKTAQKEKREKKEQRKESGKPEKREKAKLPADTGKKPEPRPVQEDTAKTQKAKPNKIFVFLQKIGKFPEKIRKCLKNLCCSIKSVQNKINHLREVFETWYHFLTEDRSKTAFSHARIIITKLLKHILPGKMRAELKIGVEDPALMGKILAGLGMLMPLYQDKLIVFPQFGMNVAEGNLKVKGRIYLIYILYLALRVYMDKAIMETIKKARAMTKGKEEEGE